MAPKAPPKLEPVILTHDQIATIAVKNGCPSSRADAMAALAIAESGGNIFAVGENRDAHGNITSYDVGLWQNNTKYHPRGATFDVDVNARSAVLTSALGTNFRPWCTAWSDGACGSNGGRYLGTRSSYIKPHLTGSWKKAELTKADHDKIKIALHKSVEEKVDDIVPAGLDGIAGALSSIAHAVETVIQDIPKLLRTLAGAVAVIIGLLLLFHNQVSVAAGLRR